MDTLRNRRSFLRTTVATTAGMAALGPAAARTASHGLSLRATRGNEKFPVHLFSKHLQFLGYDEMAETAAAVGMAGADLTVRPGGHVLPEHVKRDLPKAAKAIKTAGIRLDMITTRIGSAGEEHTEAILATAAELGVKYYRMGYYRYNSEISTEKNLDNFRKDLKALARLNEKYGLHGAYQNHSGNYFGTSTWDLARVLKDLDPRWMGCQYDLHHAMIENGKKWNFPFDLLKSHVKCMVVKDFEWVLKDGWPRRNSLALGKGVVDFESYFQLLDREGISGPLSMHIEYPLYPDEDAPKKEKKKAAMETIRENMEGLNKFLG